MGPRAAAIDGGAKPSTETDPNAEGIHNNQLKNYGVKLVAKPLPFSPYLNPKWDKLPFDFDLFSKAGKANYTHKNGQLKLLLGEVAFLTKYPEGLCVYVGSAPGTHITLLCKMFPKIKFHLYDPRDFVVKRGPQVEIF